MALSDRQAEALQHLERGGVVVDRMRVALAVANLSPGSVEIVDDTLACALMGVRREDENLGFVPEPDTQRQIDQLTRDCMVAHVAVMHTTN